MSCELDGGTTAERFSAVPPNKPASRVALRWQNPTCSQQVGPFSSDLPCATQRRVALLGGDFPRLGIPHCCKVGGSLSLIGTAHAKAERGFNPTCSQQVGTLSPGRPVRVTTFKATPSPLPYPGSLSAPLPGSKPGFCPEGAPFWTKQLFSPVILPFRDWMAVRPGPAR